MHDRRPWAAAQGVSTHWLRHTTITWVERRFSYGIARAYAGHTDSRGASTTTYIRAHVLEVAAALAVLTGEPHPLAQPGIATTGRTQAANIGADNDLSTEPTTNQSLPR